MSVELSAAIGAMIVQIASARGISPDVLCAATGFEPRLAADPDGRIPLAIETALWETAARLLKDDAFGLHAAGLMRPGSFGVMEYAVRTAPTLGRAFERLARYNRLVHDAATFTLVPRGDVVRIEHAFRTAEEAPCRHAAEFTIGALVVMSGQLTLYPIRPLAVQFRHSAPESAEARAELVRFFGTPPTFDQATNALELHRAEFDRPVSAADPALSALIERHAEALLSTRIEREGFAHAVRRLIASMLDKDGASLSAVATRLHMSERSLQRRLSEEGLTFDVILDEVRHDLALRYLADRRVAIAEVAYLLGYSEPSPFHRAFKRWTGMTPREARNRAA